MNIKIFIKVRSHPVLRLFWFWSAWSRRLYGLSATSVHKSLVTYCLCQGLWLQPVRALALTVSVTAALAWCRGNGTRCFCFRIGFTTKTPRRTNVWCETVLSLKQRLVSVTVSSMYNHCSKLQSTAVCPPPPLSVLLRTTAHRYSVTLAIPLFYGSWYVYTVKS